MIGRNLLGPPSTGVPVALTFDGLPEWKPGGLTIDWSTVGALGSQTTIQPEGLQLNTGTKYLRFGQVLCQITTTHAQTITVTGTPTGGTFPLQVVRPDNGYSQSVTVPYNSSVANTQTLLDAVLGAGNSVVSGAGALPGNVQTVTMAGIFLYEIMPLMAVGTLSNLTGGTSNAVAIAVSAGGTAGMYGPYDTAASDGRQTPTRDRIFLLNETLVKGGIVSGFSTINVDQVGAIAGGRVFRDRLVATTGTHSLILGPTFTELLAAMPRLVLVGNY